MFINVTLMDWGSGSGDFTSAKAHWRVVLDRMETYKDHRIIHEDKVRNIAQSKQVPKGRRRCGGNGTQECKTGVVLGRHSGVIGDAWTNKVTE